MRDPGASPALAERSSRRLASFAVVVLAGVACLGLAWSSSGTGERGNATIAVAGHHHAFASIHLDGVAALVAFAFGARLWANERISRLRMFVPAETSLVRRRGPPLLPAY